MSHKPRHPAPPPGPPKPDHSWPARKAALQQEGPVGWAILGAIFAWLAAMAAWVAVVIPSGGNVRFNPLFWLLAIPLMPWLWAVQSFAPWAMNTLWLALLLAPCAALAALLVAPATHDAALLGAATPLDTPGAMLIVLGLTTGLAVVGLVGLRRSSLPGGTRPPRYLPPGTPPPGARPLPAAASNALMLGSVPFSATLINGAMFSIAALLEPIGPAALPWWWPAGLVVVAVLTVGTLVFRGSFRLARRNPAAAGDLRRGWRLGMICAVLPLAALWAWPAILQGKLVFSAFMGALILAAFWCGTKALRALPGMMGGDVTG